MSAEFLRFNGTTKVLEGTTVLQVSNTPKSWGLVPFIDEGRVCYHMIANNGHTLLYIGVVSYHTDKYLYGIQNGYQEF